MGYLQVAGSFPTDVHVFMYIFQENFQMDLLRFICLFSSVDKSAAPTSNGNMGYPQIPCSVSAENPGTQLHIDLS